MVLLGGIIYIDSHTRLDNAFKKAGIVIQPPFNQLSINRDALSALSVKNCKHSKKCTFYTLRFGCSFAAVNTIKPQLL